MFFHGKMVKRNLHLITEEMPEFLDRVALEFEGLQETLHLFVVGHRSFDWCGFGSVFMVFTNGADNIVPITVNGMAEIFFLLNMRTFQNFQIQVIGIQILLLNNLKTNSIQPVIHVFNLHGSNAVNVNFGICHQFYKVRMFDNFAKESIVEASAFQKFSEAL